MKKLILTTSLALFSFICSSQVNNDTDSLLLNAMLGTEGHMVRIVRESNIFTDSVLVFKGDNPTGREYTWKSITPAQSINVIFSTFKNIVHTDNIKIDILPESKKGIGKSPWYSEDITIFFLETDGDKKWNHFITFHVNTKSNKISSISMYISGV